LSGHALTAILNFHDDLPVLAGESDVGSFAARISMDIR